MNVILRTHREPEIRDRGSTGSIDRLLQRVSKVELERNVPAAMSADVLVVDPDLRKIIYRTEMDQHPAFLKIPSGRERHLPPVPDAAHKIFIFDAGQFAFGAERDDYLPAVHGIFPEQFPRNAAVSVVNFKLPPAVQVQPVFLSPVKLRPGELFSRNRFCRKVIAHSYSPFLRVISDQTSR